MQVKPFFQARLVPRIRPAFLRRAYTQLLSNPAWFGVVNRPYIRALEKVSSPRLSAAGNRIVGDLKRDGLAFGHIDEFFTDDSFAKFQAHFYRLLEEHDRRPASEKAQAKPYLVRLGGDLVLGSDNASRIVTHPEFAAISAHYLGMVPRFSGTRMWHTMPYEAPDRIASQQWHRDFNDLKFVKIFLYLNDVDESSGPFEFIKGTHRMGPHGNVLLDNVDDKGTRDYVKDNQIAAYADRLKAGETACVGRAGTLVFADTFGFHRGGKCVNRCRDVFIMHYNTNANISHAEFTVADHFRGFDSPFMNMVFGLQ